LLANPVEGLRVLDLGDAMPDEVARALLGAASLSFYASRVVFCEGEETSLDFRLYNSWFNGDDTVVRNVGSCESVLRCVDSISQSRITASLTAIGIIDRDFIPEEFLAQLPADATALDVHEVEGLFCVPGVVAAVGRHLGIQVAEASYVEQLRQAVSPSQRHKIIVERWKRRLGPLLEGVVAGVGVRDESLDILVGNLPDLFDHENWNFSPVELLQNEKELVERAASSGPVAEFLKIIPNKAFVAIAARIVGVSVPRYVDLVVDALSETKGPLETLGLDIAGVLASHLPERRQSSVDVGE
jgi:hypothetical protein